MIQTADDHRDREFDDGPRSSELELLAADEDPKVQLEYRPCEQPDPQHVPRKMARGNRPSSWRSATNCSAGPGIGLLENP